jgi:glycosyltransferase involved in cell wall biosynthesis
MKICQYIPHGAIPDIRGFAPAIVAQQFYKNFSHDIEHYFVCNQEDYKDKFVIDKEYGKIFRIKESNFYKRLFQKITKLDPYPLYKRLAKIVNQNKIEILHVHQLEFPINQFKKLLKNSNIKIIIHVHAIRKFNSELGIADAYLAVSDYTKNMLIKKCLYPKNLIKVIYNGVDTNLFKVKNQITLLHIKEFYSIPKNSIIISYIGRKQQSKGFFVFLKTIDFLFKSQKYNIFALCVGAIPPDTYKDTNYEEEYTLLNNLKQYSSFLDLPPMQHSKLAQIYKISDIILFPTYFQGEQHPLVALEAIASNSILITSNMFSLNEIIQDNYNGFLLKNPQDEEETISKVINIIQNISKLQPIRDNAYTTASEKFDWKISSHILEYTYKNIILKGKING